jgi:hypothetical protein
MKEACEENMLVEAFGLGQDDRGGVNITILIIILGTTCRHQQQPPYTNNRRR